MSVGLEMAAIWAVLITIVILVPRIRVFKGALTDNPDSKSSLAIAAFTAMVWGIAPFMVWQAGQGQDDVIAIMMLGMGFLLVINKYRTSVRMALLVATPYLMLIAWFLYETRTERIFSMAVLATVAYLTILGGFLFSAHKRKQKIVAFKLEQDEIRMKLEKAHADAEKTNQEKLIFFANINHELRTPLNGILGLSDVLLTESMTTGQIRNVSLIQDSGKMLLALLNDILDLSKIEAEGITIEYMDVDLDELLHDLYSFWKPLADKKQISLVFEKQKGLPEVVQLDPMRFRQCVNNLINNAIKFTPCKGQIIVTTTGSKYEDVYNLTLAVQDTGIGIRKESITKLFKPFSQAEIGTARKFGGTGLGLAITRKLCRLMDGDISVTSEFGEGATFAMSIIARISGRKALPKEEHYKETPKSSFSGLRCLVVEDNENNTQMLLLLMQSFGLDVVSTSNGFEAIDALEKQYFDFVLMNLQMVNLGGIEATRLIRASEKSYASVPIIAMTASAMNSDCKKCLAIGVDEYVGVDEYISKPLSWSQLEKAIANVMRSKVKTAKILPETPLKQSKIAA